MSGNKFGHLLLLACAVLAIFVVPVRAFAYTARGITNPSGLVYDDVYGVSKGAAIMRRGSKIEIIDALGNVLLSTTEMLTII